MATGYTRQSAANIVDNDVIYAADLNGEFNQLQSAFDKTSGHTHDGTIGGGAQIPFSSISGAPTLGTAASQNVGSGANNVVQRDASGNYPAGNGAAITAIAVANITGIGTAATLNVGTAANNLVQRDASGGLAIAGEYYPLLDKGTVSTGTVTFTVSTNNVQRLQVGGALTIALAGWPTTGNEEFLMVELVNGGSATITWPTINWFKTDGSGTFTTTFPYTLQSSGTDFAFIWSRDGGTTYYGRVLR